MLIISNKTKKGQIVYRKGKIVFFKRFSGLEKIKYFVIIIYFFSYEDS